jgi:Fe-S cluster assembly protein SufD
MPKQYSIQPTNAALSELFSTQLEVIAAGDDAAMTSQRQEAIAQFGELGFPTPQLEEWRNTSLEEALGRKYVFSFDRPTEKTDINSIFQCEIHNFETYLLTQRNGWYLYENSPLSELPGGVIVGSLSEAVRRYPEIIAQHYGRYADIKKNGLIALNTAFAQDGIFIMVPDHVSVEKPVQMVNIVDAKEPLFLQPRHLIILGKNSRLTLVHCDDSARHETTFSNAVTEVFADEGSSFELYKMQNKDAGSSVVTSVFVHQKSNSNVQTHTLTLNGGLIRNDIYAELTGSGCDTKLYGLYLVDRQQHVDNQVYVEHAGPGNTSLQLYKGIIDDEASAVFNGHIMVHPQAQKTEAYQTNRNILLTDAAKVTAKPFLEIYADDVKCSHGVTIGQLDADALFYLRSRGICNRNARMLLMYAFAADLVNKISISLLRERLDQMVQKRLRGELSICDQCVLHCKEDLSLTFDIDMSKI